jgi:hypothetical protein
VPWRKVTADGITEGNKLPSSSRLSRVKHVGAAGSTGRSSHESWEALVGNKSLPAWEPSAALQGEGVHRRQPERPGLGAVQPGCGRPASRPAPLLGCRRRLGGGSGHTASATHRSCRPARQLLGKAGAPSPLPRSPSASPLPRAGPSPVPCCGPSAARVWWKRPGSHVSLAAADGRACWASTWPPGSRTLAPPA